MSIYITVNQANLLKKPSNDICFMIESKQSVLKSKTVKASQNPKWEDSFICSEQEKQLLVNIIQANQSTYSVQIDKYVYGQALINFNQLFIKSQPRKHLFYQIDIFKGNKCTGNIEIGVFYNETQNYIGQIEFYDLKKLKLEIEKSRKNYITKIETDSNISQKRIQRQNQKQDKKYEVPFYSGPCKSKNFFSCMDENVLEQTFYVIEKKY